MSSLAEEIVKLHELHVAGILSSEEFADAKKALISGGPARQLGASAPIADNSAPATTSTSSRALGNTSTFAPDTSGFEASSIGIHTVAYGHLSAILKNILSNPTDPKYRRLRRTNPRLSSELFNSLGAETFLASIGFVDVQEGTGPDTEYLVLPLLRNVEPSPTISSSAQVDSNLTPPDSVPVQLQKITIAMSKIEELQQRDDRAAAEAIDAAKVLRNVALDIRHEQCKKAVAEFTGKASHKRASSGEESASAAAEAKPLLLSRLGPMDAFLVSLFLNDDLDEEGSLAAGNVARLITVSENALKALTATTKEAFDSANKFLRMPLTNLAASKLVLGQKGAIEALVEKGGWILRGTASGSTEVTVLWASAVKQGIAGGGPTMGATVETRNYISTQLLSSGVPHDIMLPAEFEDIVGRKDLETKALSLVELLKTVQRALGDMAKTAAMKAREEALVSMKEEMRKSVAEEKRHLKKKNDLLSPTLVSGDNDSATTNGTNIRIKTADAIRILLGKDTKEDVLQRTADAAKASAKAPRAAAQSRLLANYDHSRTTGEGDSTMLNGNDNDNENLPQTAITANQQDFESDWSDE